MLSMQPGGNALSYSVSYISGTVPSNETFTYNWKYYAYGSSIGTTYLYWYSGGTLNLLSTHIRTTAYRIYSNLELLYKICHLILVKRVI